MTSMPAGFTPATQAWLDAAFAAPTPAQEQAWSAIATGQHVLVVAPTGSGKTLAAFLWALDQLHSTSIKPDPARRCRVLTSAGREALRGIDTVILDEMHAIAGTKRGAHLALSPSHSSASTPCSPHRPSASGSRPPSGIVRVPKERVRANSPSTRQLPGG
jgi:ATP-dependent Lhr-like helicase